MYQNFAELLELAKTSGRSIWQVVLENEEKLTELTEEEIFHRLDGRFEIMLASAQKALEQPLPTVGNLISGITTAQHRYTEKGETVSGSFVNRVMALALSSSEVNAAMGKICAAPTAGSCGILPAVLIAMTEKLKLTRRETLQGMLTASGVGAVIMKNATVAGSEGGCQAECGVAAAMSAAAAVEMYGGAPETALRAVSIALMNAMGLVCDPVAGLVQVPCAQRNASQAVNAVLSADLALAGMDPVIPPDEMVEALYRVGKKMPMELRETALGGIAVTPTGKRLKKQIFNL